jgi:hypothetical protein
MNSIGQITSLINEWYEVQNASEEIRLDWEDRMLTSLFPVRYDNIGELVNQITGVMLLSDNQFMLNPTDTISLELFKRQSFNTFMEFFTRELSEETHNRIKESTQGELMVLQNESYIESFGDIDTMSTILRMKKSPEDVVEAFKNFDIDLDGYKFLNTKLLLTFYHRIHSPIKGQIMRAIPIPKELDIFGNHSLWIVDIYSEECGHLYLMLVGESQIQDFDFKVNVGDYVDVFDELGNFNWGSQTIILYNGKKIPQDLTLSLGYRYFVGSKIF